MVIQYEYLFRMIIASLCGCIIGFERNYHHKQAGMKTFLVVALASCTMMLVSKYGFDDVQKVDASRIASQVVSGISFLGAGIIMKRNQNIEGLTTAAGIWSMAGIGLALGAGMYFIGLSTTVLYLIFSSFVQVIEKRNKITSGGYTIVTNSHTLVKELANQKEPNKVLSVSIFKDEEGIFELKISIQFGNENEKRKWENVITSSKRVISYEYNG